MMYKIDNVPFLPRYSSFDCVEGGGGGSGEGEERAGGGGFIML